MREAVALLIQRHDRKILGVTRGLFRIWDVNLPGGKVEPGESLIDAVIREAREETGLLITDPVPVYKRVCTGDTDFECTVFTASASIKDLKTCSHEGWTRWIPHTGLRRGTFADYNKVMLGKVDINHVRFIGA